VTKLTRQERETVVNVNDAGEASVWTSSPVMARRLTRRLGDPTKLSGSWRWDMPALALAWKPRLKARKGAKTA
jgi:hypothetical protein